MGVEISGEKLTPFSTRGPLSVDELELLSAVGETVPLDELLPAKPVKIGDSWPVPGATLALLLGLDEVTSNTVQVTLKEVTPDFARLELAGRAEGKLYGAMNQIALKAKCRFDRHAVHRLVCDGPAADPRRKRGRVRPQLDVSGEGTRNASNKLGGIERRCAADVPVKPTDELLRVQYHLERGDVQLTHDRAWFLTGHYSDQDEFHRLDRSQDIGLCKVSPQPQVSVAKLPNAAQFQEIVRKALGDKFGDVVDVADSRNERTCGL